MNHGTQGEHSLLHLRHKAPPLHRSPRSLLNKIWHAMRVTTQKPYETHLSWSVAKSDDNAMGIATRRTECTNSRMYTRQISLPIKVQTHQRNRAWILNFRQLFMSLSYWWLILLQSCQSCQSCPYISYFDNVMMKFVINNRTDAWKKTPISYTEMELPQNTQEYFSNYSMQGHFDPLVLHVSKSFEERSITQSALSWFNFVV